MENADKQEYQRRNYQKEPYKKGSCKKTFYLAVFCVLFTGAAAMGFLLNEIYEERYNLPESSSEQNIMSADAEPQKQRTFQWQQCYELCQLYDLDCEPVEQTGDAATEEMLRSLSLSELIDRYPIPDWTITEDQQQVVTICRNMRGLCEIHQKVYHLGINESGQYLAVYMGPSAVGDAGGAFLVTDILADRLSAEQRMELEAGAYEYYSQDDLISMLDNFSEL